MKLRISVRGMDKDEMDKLILAFAYPAFQIRVLYGGGGVDCLEIKGIQAQVEEEE